MGSGLAEADIEFWIKATFSGLLGREPDPTGATFYADQLRSGVLPLDEFIRQVSSSVEFRKVHHLRKVPADYPIGCSSMEAMDVFGRFDRYTGPGQAGFITNFLGCVTDVRHVNLPAFSQLVESYPIPRNFHAGVLEWLGVLRAVLEAKGAFRMIELGAGWAPWCAIGYKAARQKGLSARVTAVEGDEGHVAYIRQAFRDNGIPEADAEIICGVVGMDNGVALFPRSKDASTAYGGAAAFGNHASMNDPFNVFVSHNRDNVDNIERIPSYTLEKLLKDANRVDLIHCDIQGAEADIFEDQIETVTAKVKRIIVGAHSFGIDRRLIGLFPRYGWIAEGIEHTCMAEHDGHAHTATDGTQVWRNSLL